MGDKTMFTVVYWNGIYEVKEHFCELEDAEKFAKGLATEYRIKQVVS